MAVLTSYGTLWGAVPATAGNVWWVAPSASYTIGAPRGGLACSASDSNSGRLPEDALLTLAQAITNATANNGDVIVLLPGAHSWTATAALSKAGITVMGLSGPNWLRPRTSITTSAADEIINVTAADCEIANLRVIVVTAQTGIDFSSAANRLYVHDCSFDMTATANTAMRGLGHASATGYTVAPANVLIQHNYFEITGAQGPALALGDAADFIVERNAFAVKGGTLAVMTLQGGVLGWGVYRDNDVSVLKNAIVTKGFTGTDITSTLSVGLYRNFFGGTVTNPIDDFGSTDAYIAENYAAGTGGGAGGVLWSSIT